MSRFFVWPADEKLIWHDVAAGLPRQISNDFNTQWRRKAASTPFFISLPDVSRDNFPHFVGFVC
jgi:hypothetical protein